MQPFALFLPCSTMAYLASSIALARKNDIIMNNN